MTGDVENAGRSYWWVALNGASSSIAPVSLKRPKVIPVPQQLLGFPTWGEAKEAQRICLTAPKDEVRRYLLSLWGDIVAGRILVIVPPNPEPPTLRETIWAEATEETAGPMEAAEVA